MLTLFWFAFYLSIFVVLYERREGLAALRRGWQLIRGTVWRALGYLLLFFLFSWIFGGIVGGLLVWASMSVAFLVENPLLSVVVQLVATSLTGLLTSPLIYAVAALLYFDLRVRHEGLDVALATARASGEPLDLAAMPVSDEPVLNESTWKAVGMLAALYTGTFVLLCGCFFFLVFGLGLLFSDAGL